MAINLPNGRLIRRNPPTVNVVFAVDEFVDREAMAPLKIENITDKAYIETEAVKVTYKVRNSLAGQIAEDQIEVIADFNKMSLEDSTIMPQLISFPDRITDVKIDTARIKVKFNE